MTYEDQLRMIRDIAQREANARRGLLAATEPQHLARFTPRMTVSAEIAIGQRRLIEFFAAPIVSALNEAGRER